MSRTADYGPRGHIEHLVVNEMPWIPRTDSDGLSGWRVRELSIDADTGACSFMARVAPCWRRQGSYRAATMQEMLVLQGGLRAGDILLGEGDYIAYPPGSVVPPMSSRQGCQLYLTADGPWGRDGGDRGDIAMAPVHRPAAARAWLPPPAYDGRSLEETVGGMTMQMLRKGGCDEPYTFLVRCAAGWADPREESHETWEELFLLAGDYMMGDFGRIEAGSYIFRPGLVPHGPQATARGSVFLTRGEKLINFCFRPIHDADSMIADYLNLGAILPPAKDFISWL